MRPITHTLINHVRAPIDRVFSVLTDPDRMAGWLPGCSGVESTGGVKKGSRLQPRFGSRQSEFEVVDFAPPHTFGWVERGQRRGSKTFFRLEVVGDATAITIRDVSTPASFFAWVRGRLRPKRDVVRNLNAILENVQRLVAS
jgi:uncharacterized protein YndB with AHSA1/START domain